jgi:hypothetical protein
VDADDTVTGTGERRSEHMYQEGEEWNKSGRVNKKGKRKTWKKGIGVKLSIINFYVCFKKITGSYWLLG